MTEMTTTKTLLQDAALSIVIPALNEQDNVQPLVEQIDQQVRQTPLFANGIDVELIIFDDGSTDATQSRLLELRKKYPWLVILARQTPLGQSAAMGAGIAAATKPNLATLDADLQNDPAELPAMLKMMIEQNLDMVQGDRSHARKDNLIRRVGSIVGRKARYFILGDRVRDTGCSARVMRTDMAQKIPLHFKGIHRFFPAYMKLLGAKIGEMQVTHRPRTAGETKYGLGILTRGPAGLIDLLAVRWMSKRYRHSEVKRCE